MTSGAVPLDPLDHFSLLGLPARYALDPAALDSAYKAVQSRVHPDRFASGTPAERRIAMQWATRANEAYSTLRQPLARAAYLCERAGAPIEAESNTAMPATFLMQQLEWREALDDARASADAGALDALVATMQSQRAATEAAIAGALDADHDAPRAAALVRQAMFIERFRDELLQARRALAGNDN